MRQCSATLAIRPLPPILETRLLRLTPLVLVLLALAAGILPRLKAHAALRMQTQSFSSPVVSVVHPKAAPAVQRIELPAPMCRRIKKPRSLRAPTAYLAHWYKDIGTQVPAGELLAYIETPRSRRATRAGARRSEYGTSPSTTSPR